MTRALASIGLILLLASAGGGFAYASSSDVAQMDVGVPEGAAGADVPFTNDGANRPVLETMTPDGHAIPIDPAAADRIPVDAQAAVANHTQENAAGHGKRKGLPQFDPTTFTKQIFWLTLVFVVLYMVNAKKILPTISSVIENRRERVASDLRAAEDLKNQVAQVRGEYEAAVATAQAEAQKIILDLQTEIKKQNETQEAIFRERSEKAADDLEERLDMTRARITHELNAMAADLTADITKTIAGITVDSGTARRAIDDLSGKARAA